MSVLYNRIAELCEAKGITAYRLCKEAGLAPGIITDLKMGRKNGLSAKNADKIATYFGVSVGYLLGNEELPEKKKTAAQTERQPVSEDDIKFALFGGDGEITDAMYREVCNFAAYVKQREAANQKKE